jgi:hypothetical protein
MAAWEHPGCQLEIWIVRLEANGTLRMRQLLATGITIVAGEYMHTYVRGCPD